MDNLSGTNQNQIPADILSDFSRAELLSALMRTVVRFIEVIHPLDSNRWYLEV